MIIYFAGSIRGGRQDAELYNEIIAYMRTVGDVLTEHIGDSNVTLHGENKSSAYIYRRDMDWLHEADCVIAEVTQPSLGVGYEIGWAENKKPILCLYRKKEGVKLSAMIDGNPSLVVKPYTTLDEAKQIIRDFIAAQSFA